MGMQFSYLYETPELSSISQEYATSAIALQILDGSAYKRALDDFTNNPSLYLRKQEFQKSR